MANYNNFMNQLYRQKDNIENMIAQYSQQNGLMGQPAPVQNIINTSNSSDTDVKFINKEDDINNIIVTKKTLFIDEFKNKISLKEIDGTISKSYDIIVPKDEKDLKIEELENKLKELEEKINDKSTSIDVTNNDVKSTTTSVRYPIIYGNGNENYTDGQFVILSCVRPKSVTTENGGSI